MESQSHEYVETTLLELLTAIDRVVETDDEAFAVLESMLAEGRISLRCPPPSAFPARPRH